MLIVFIFNILTLSFFLLALCCHIRFLRANKFKCPGEYRFISLDTDYYFFSLFFVYKLNDAKKNLSICFRLYTLVSVSLAMFYLNVYVCSAYTLLSSDKMCIIYFQKVYCPDIASKRASFDLHIVATM